MPAAKASPPTTFTSSSSKHLENCWDIMGEEIDDELPDAQDVLRSAVATPRKRLAALERDVRPPKHLRALTRSRPPRAYAARSISSAQASLALFLCACWGRQHFHPEVGGRAAPLVIIVAAWRLPAAVTLLRAEPATEFAALSHMLMNGLRLVHGFFIAHLSLWPPEASIVPGYLRRTCGAMAECL